MTSISSDVIRCAEMAMAEEIIAEDSVVPPPQNGDIAILHSTTSIHREDSFTTSAESSTGSVITDESGTCSPNKNRSKSFEDVLETPQCGWYFWKPNCLQRVYNYKTALLLMCCFAFLQGVVVNGLTPLNTGSLERRFGLASVESGWLNSAYDVAAATATVFLSYLADRRHKPRWLMFSALCFTAGSLVFALPHFIASPYSGGVTQTPLCAAKTGASHTLAATSEQQRSCGTSSTDQTTTSPSSYWPQVLLVGQIIMGLGGAVIYTVGVAFIDDFSEPNSSGLHVGLTFLSTAVGAAAGYGVGSALLSLSVNFNRPDWPQFEKSYNDPNSVGAWWLGYLMCSGLFLLVALGFSCFDYEMPETAELKLRRQSETHSSSFSDVKSSTENPIVNAMIGFLNSLLKLVTNPVLVCVTLAVVLHSLFSAGIQPFFVKIIENQFHVSETKAGLVVGAIIIIGISTSALLSGYIMKRFEMTVRGTLLMIVIFVFLSLGFSLGLMMHCDSQQIIGVNVGYDQYGRYSLSDVPKMDQTVVEEDIGLSSSCNAGCNCSTIDYIPVCHRPTQSQFFSPCHAGCRVLLNDDGSRSFTDCSCVSSAISGGLDFNSSITPVGNVLTYGICEFSCPQFYPAIILLFFFLFCGFYNAVPITGIVMRCVKDEDRSMALAFNQSGQRFLGNIPGPLLMGRLIDFTCIFRREYCDSSVKGACFTYDTKRLAQRLTILCLGLNSAAFLLYVLAFFLYKPPSGQSVTEYVKDLANRLVRKPKVSTGEEAKDVENSRVGMATKDVHLNAAFSDASLMSAHKTTLKVNLK